MYTPEGKRTNFKRDYGYCEGIPYVYLGQTEFGVVIVQKVIKQLEGYTKQEAEKSKLACEPQGMVEHPSDTE